MKTIVEKQSEAFREVLELCRLHGLFWKDHVIAEYKNGYIYRYYIIDETFSTAVATIYA